METPLSKWSTIESDLPNMLKSLKDHWDNFSIDMKVKITHAASVQLMQTLKGAGPPVDDVAQSLVDSTLPGLGSCTWDPLKPSFASLALAAFTKMEVMISEIEAGTEHSDEQLASVGDHCNRVLKELLESVKQQNL